MQNLGSIHIVRKFGPVGGMENYVWKLTHKLKKIGYPVTVLCEVTFGKPDTNIKVIEVGQHFSKPRWLSMLKFSRKIEKKLRCLDIDQQVIHSHERCRSHHITTFHGPPIVHRKKSSLDSLSLRLKTWEYLEKRELSGNNLRYIVPVSILAQTQLLSYYPLQAGKIVEPIFPGVGPISTKKDKTVKKNSNQFTIGFIGKEWKRKGLNFVANIVYKLRQGNPNIHLLIAGGIQSEAQSLFKSWKGGYTFLGWTKHEDFYTQIDLLIHPAKIEPFGMVIAEANQYEIPVLISDKCGIVDLIGAEQGKVLSLDSESQWIESVQQLLFSPPKIKKLDLTWEDCALQYLDLYKKVLS